MKIINYILVFLISISFAFAQYDDCPFGEVDEPYPGTCGRYTDTDSDNLCDHSQKYPTKVVEEEEVPTQINVDVHDIITGKELKTKSIEEVSALYGIDKEEYAKKLSEYYNVQINSNDHFQTLHDNIGLEPSIAKEIAQSLISNEPIQVVLNETKTGLKERYPLVVPSLIITLIYIISYVMAKKKKIKMINHKKLWNILLLISFIISGVSGIYLALKINYRWNINLPFNTLFWHVEFGIVMFLIAIFHIVWHGSYFINMVIKKNKASKR